MVIMMPAGLASGEGGSGNKEVLLSNILNQKTLAFFSRSVSVQEESFRPNHGSINRNMLCLHRNVKSVFDGRGIAR